MTVHCWIFQMIPEQTALTEICCPLSHPSEFKAADFKLRYHLSRRLKWTSLAVTSTTSCCRHLRVTSSFDGCSRLGWCLILIWCTGKVMERCLGGVMYTVLLSATRWQQRLSVSVLHSLFDQDLITRWCDLLMSVWVSLKKPVKNTSGSYFTLKHYKNIFL